MVLKMNLFSPRRRQSVVTPRYKSLQFDETVNIQYVEHVNDLDDDTFHSIYYSRNDYMRFKKEAKLTAEVLRSKYHAKRLAANNSKVTLCPRGLERHLGSKRDKLKKVQRIMNARTTVLQEQKEQKRLGTKDAKLIAYIYRDMSKSSCKEAYDVALQDQEEVQDKVEEESNVDNISTPSSADTSSISGAPPVVASTKVLADSSTDIMHMPTNRFLAIKAMISGVA